MLCKTVILSNSHAVIRNFNSSLKLVLVLKLIMQNEEKNQFKRCYVKCSKLCDALLKFALTKQKYHILHFPFVIIVLNWNTNLKKLDQSQRLLDLKYVKCGFIVFRQYAMIVSSKAICLHEEICKTPVVGDSDYTWSELKWFGTFRKMFSQDFCSYICRGKRGQMERTQKGEW